MSPQTELILVLITIWKYIVENVSHMPLSFKLATQSILVLYCYNCAVHINSNMKRIISPLSQLLICTCEMITLKLLNIELLQIESTAVLPLTQMKVRLGLCSRQVKCILVALVNI